MGVETVVSATHNKRSMPPKKPVNANTYPGRLAVRLRAMREEAGLSVKDVSTALIKAGFQVGEAAIYSWEQGRSSPHVETMPLLAKLFGLTGPRDVLPPK